MCSMSDTAVLSDDARTERMKALQSVIELIRPVVQQDGGDLALTSVDVETGGSGFALPSRDLYNATDAPPCERTSAAIRPAGPPPMTATCDTIPLPNELIDEATTQADLLIVCAALGDTGEHIVVAGQVAVKTAHLEP